MIGALNEIEYIKKFIRGRLCDERNNCFYLASIIALAGHGDHLEIGTLHGGSAILAALVKKRLGFSGMIYCIDPLNGYYKGTMYEKAVDIISLVPVSFDILRENIQRFDVYDRIIAIQAKSNPFPRDPRLPERFETAYIDGNHWEDAPLDDWNSIKDKVNQFVVFDNADRNHQAVMRAVRVAGNDPDWNLIYWRDITAVVERKREHI